MSHPFRVREIALQAGLSEATVDRVLNSRNGVRASTAAQVHRAVAELERRTGKPVVSSNQASIWAAYRAIGLKPKITGFGRLLESLAA